MAAKKKKKKGTSSQKQGNKQIKSVSHSSKQTELASNTSHSKNWLLYLATLVLAITTYLTYSGALDNEFVDWDDYAYVIDNDLVRPASDIAQTPLNGPSEYTKPASAVFSTIVSLNYHPLTMLTMRWNNNVCPECINGISARPFIWWNILIHIFNTILVLFFIFWLTNKNLLGAVFVAAIFGLHPMHVESVAWVSERKDVLYVFFFMLGLLSYSKYLDKPSSKWLGITMLLFILACLSKAMAVVFAPVLLLLNFWKRPENNHFEALKNTFAIKNMLHLLPFFLVALVFGLIATNVQSGSDFYGMLVKTSDSVAINKFDTFSIVQRLQFACYGFVEYIIKFFVPTNLCTFYPYPDQPTYDNSSWFSIVPVIVLAILSFAVYSLKFSRSIAFGIAFYLITVLLVLQFLSVGVVLIADRYTYLPYVGLACILVLLVQEFGPQKWQQPILGSMCIFSLLMIPKTMAQIETWQNSDTLWTNVIDLHKLKGAVLQQNMEQPLSIRGNYYGKMSEKAKTPAESMSYIDKAFEDFKIAAQLGSTRAEVYEGMGNSYGRRGYQMQIEGKLEEAKQLLEQALSNYSKALEYKPGKGSTYFNRAITYSILGQHQQSIEDYSLAMQYQPQQIQKASVNRGIAYLKLRQYQAAADDFSTALQYAPNNTTALLNRGVALSNLGRNTEAINDFNLVLALDPNNAEAKRYIQQINNAQ